MALADWEIKQLCEGTDIDEDMMMVRPFIPTKSYMGHLSYGLGHAGYDVRLGYPIIYYLYGSLVDPGDPESKPMQLHTREFSNLDAPWLLKPGDFILAPTFEMFNIPTNVHANVADKSTLARLGIAVQNTILEPGWRGILTMEISNHGPNTIALRFKMPIAQIIFHPGEVSEKAYEGRYQDQRGTTPPISVGKESQ